MTDAPKLIAVPRVNRVKFWLGCAATWTCLTVVSSAAWQSTALGWCTAVVATLALIYLSIGRLHDLGRRGYWLLVVVVPVVGALWLVWTLSFCRGEPLSNRWGPGSLKAHDFLKVTT